MSRAGGQTPPDGRQLAEGLRQICIALSQRDETNLTTRQFAVLLLCHSDTELLTPAELVARLGITPTAVSSALDALEGFRLVKRINEIDDRRRVLIDVTASGRDLLQRVHGGA